MYFSVLVTLTASLCMYVVLYIGMYFISSTYACIYNYELILEPSILLHLFFVIQQGRNVNYIMNNVSNIIFIVLLYHNGNFILQYIINLFCFFEGRDNKCHRLSTLL